MITPEPGETWPRFLVRFRADPDSGGLYDDDATRDRAARHVFRGREDRLNTLGATGKVTGTGTVTHPPEPPEPPAPAVEEDDEA